MGKSLQDQLLNVGVVDKNKIKKVKAEQRKKNKQKQHHVDTTDEIKLLAQKKQAEKAERDRQFNQQKRDALAKKERATQIAQIVEQNDLLQGDEEIPFNFVENNRVKKIYVSEAIRAQLGRGSLAIVKQEKRYAVVPITIAEKIIARDENAFMIRNDRNEPDQDDDPYADYQIPDDLNW